MAKSNSKGRRMRHMASATSKVGRLPCKDGGREHTLGKIWAAPVSGSISCPGSSSEWIWWRLYWRCYARCTTCLHSCCCGRTYCHLQASGLTELLQCWLRYSELGWVALEGLVVSFCRMRIEGEQQEVPTFGWRQTSSRSRSTVPARLKTFIMATALETQFCELGNPFSSKIEFWKYLRLTDLTSSSGERSLSSVEIVTVLGLAGR